LGNMGSEVEEHITKKYDIKKRLGKGVRMLFYSTSVIYFNKLYGCCLQCVLSAQKNGWTATLTLNHSLNLKPNHIYPTYKLIASSS